MKKLLMIVLGLIVVGAAAYFGGAALQKSTSGTDGIGVAQGNAPTLSDSAEGRPDRAAEIRGTVKAVEGDRLVVARAKNDPLAEMTEEEREARRRERMNLSMEERQALRQQEMQGLETEDVNVTIPVGVEVIKSIPGEGQAGAGEPASLSDIKVGSNVIIWTEGGETNDAIAEYVRIAGIQ